MRENQRKAKALDARGTLNFQLFFLRTRWIRAADVAPMRHFERNAPANCQLRDSIRSLYYEHVIKGDIAHVQTR